MKLVFDFPLFEPLHFIIVMIKTFFAPKLALCSRLFALFLSPSTVLNLFSTLTFLLFASFLDNVLREIVLSLITGWCKRKENVRYLVAFKNVLLNSHDARESVLAVSAFITSAWRIVVLFLHVSTKISGLGEPIEKRNLRMKIK